VAENGLDGRTCGEYEVIWGHIDVFVVAVRRRWKVENSTQP